MREQAHLWHVPHLNTLSLLKATFVTHAFKRHWHDEFVIGLVEAGLQTFTYGRQSYITPPTGIIVINPGEAHTGQAADTGFFHYRALYPSLGTMQQVMVEVTGRTGNLPWFGQPVLHDPSLFAALQRLHQMLEQPGTRLEHESLYLSVLAQLVRQHAQPRPQPPNVRRERHEVRRPRQYLHERYAEDIRLDDLAALLNWNPYYLLRVFRNETGLPPHAYLEMIRCVTPRPCWFQGRPLIEVAYATGFSSQSHFTTTFKRLVGVTPGQYARQVNFLKDAPTATRYPDAIAPTLQDSFDEYDI